MENKKEEAIDHNFNYVFQTAINEFILRYATLDEWANPNATLLVQLKIPKQAKIILESFFSLMSEDVTNIPQADFESAYFTNLVFEGLRSHTVNFNNADKHKTLKLLKKMATTAPEELNKTQKRLLDKIDENLRKD